VVALASGWQPPAWLSFTNLLGDQADWVPDAIKKRPEVRLIEMTVQSGRSADAVVVATGYLESRRQARIGARAPGRLEVIYVEEGSRVKADEILAVLEHADLDASFAAAEATVARAKSALAEQEISIQQAQEETERAEKLWKQRSVSEAERDQAKFAYSAAVARKVSLEADLQLAIARRSEAEQLKNNMFIRAPFDGTVISKDAEVGESILPGGMGEASGRGSVATIADLEHLEIECDVKEDFITRVVEGQFAEVAVDAVPGKKYQGVVRKIIPMGNRARATIKVQVAITDADRFLFPEMSGTVYFLPEQSEPNEATDQPRLFCPDSALSVVKDEKTQEVQHAVWTVNDAGRAERNLVTLGESRDGRTEILSGITRKQRIISNPDQLVDGTPVKVIE
jgi:RND family efflux transporter MFP subunit